MKVRDRSSYLERKDKRYSPNEVLSAIPELWEDQYINFDGEDISMISLRYRTFLKSLECVSCSIKGEYFIMERNLGSTGRFHFNLFAVDECMNEIIMTKDHIIPKSKGGSDDLDNLETMCYICNEHKGNGE